MEGGQVSVVTLTAGTAGSVRVPAGRLSVCVSVCLCLCALPVSVCLSVSVTVSGAVAFPSHWGRVCIFRVVALSLSTLPPDRAC
eukprot:792477-Rhodomonas_salina.1